MQTWIAAFLMAVTPLASQGEPAVPSERAALLERLVPQPAALELREGSFPWGDKVEIRFEVTESGSDGLSGSAGVLAQEFSWLTGRVPLVAPLGAGDELQAPVVILTFGNPQDERFSQGGYELLVDPDRIEIRGANVAALSRGSATLLQTFDGATVPCCLIRDEPAFAFRALHVDVARQPHSIGVLEDVVRIARLYKFNYVQLHLTDDQHFTFPFLPVTSKLENNAVFPRDALEQLVEYAAVRGVTLVPEIDLPGHSRRLVESGYLPGAKTHGDVADPKHFKRIHNLLDDVLEVFHDSPFLHIGGDESAAGDALVPFLGSMQRFVRGKQRRMIVWEGFHGAPVDVLPATGPDRILVAAWESSYNPPWDLLEAGYQLINASWKPLYVVGGHTRVHPGSSGGRKWSPKAMARWHPHEFWHWEPGRPVFEDQGPKDQDLDDGVWSAAWIDRGDQVLGAQISLWEQRESSVVDDLRMRAPVVAERLWSGRVTGPELLVTRAQEVDAHLAPLIQPVEVVTQAHPEPGEPSVAEVGPGVALFQSASPRSKISLRNRTALPGEIRYTLVPFDGTPTWIDFGRPGDPTDEGKVFEEPIPVGDGLALRAQLVGEDGVPMGGGTWARFAGWPARVRVTEFDIGRRTPDEVPDFGDVTKSLRTYTLPLLRGPIGHTAVMGQRLDATLIPPGSGRFKLAVKTQSGHASLFVQRQDGWRRLIADTPSTEVAQSVELELQEGTPLSLRVDHATGLPRPVLIVTLDGPGTKGPVEITPFLKPLTR